MIFRKFLPFLLLLCLLCSTVYAAAVPAEWDDQTYLYDAAHILDEQEEAELNSYLSQLSRNTLTELIVVTANSYSTADENQTATYCHQYSFSGNAVILLLSFSEYGNSYYTCAYGDAWEKFDDRAYDKVENACVPLLRSGDYAEAIRGYGDACADVISSYGKLPTGGFVICILIGALLSFLIPMNILKGQLKTVRCQPEAGSYILNDSIHFTIQSDNFSHRNVTRVAKPKNTSGSRGSSGGGGGGRGGSF